MHPNLSDILNPNLFFFLILVRSTVATSFANWRVAVVEKCNLPIVYPDSLTQYSSKSISIIKSTRNVVFSEMPAHI
jgi:hypothetical protein